MKIQKDVDQISKKYVAPNSMGAWNGMAKPENNEGTPLCGSRLCVGRPGRPWPRSRGPSYI